MDLHAYNAWRRALVPHEVGTRFEFLKPHQSTTVANSFKAGQTVELVKVRDPFLTVREAKYPCDQTCEMVLISKSGKRFKKDLHVSVEGVHKWLDDGTLKLVDS